MDDGSNQLQSQEDIDAKIKRIKEWQKYKSLFIQHWLDWAVQSFVATIKFSCSAQRGCFLLNGSAAVALLAFLGTVNGRFCAIGKIQWALGSFCFGCICSVVTSFCAYCSQGHYTSESVYHALTWSDSKLFKLDKDQEAERKKGNLGNWLAIIFGGISIISFVAGVILFACSLSALNVTTPYP